MIFNETPLSGSYIIQTEPYEDGRGLFERIYCINEYSKINLIKGVVQINHSLTKRMGTVRGMHFQYPPGAENKIIRCIKGTVFDVIIDLRKNSHTYLNWFGAELSAENMKIIFVPEGFAHGFQTLDDNCELLYLHTEFYDKQYEGGIRYNDPMVGIGWKLPVKDVSERDLNLPLINNGFKGIEL